MNVFNKVTLASLKKNRTRTVVTIIGIMLSAAMICASTTFVASMQNFVLRYTVYKTGDWHGAVYDAAYKDYEDIGGSGKVASATYAQVLGMRRSTAPTSASRICMSSAAMRRPDILKSCPCILPQESFRKTPRRSFCRNTLPLTER